MLRTIMYVYCALHACITCITGEKGIEPLSVVLETTVLPIKLFSRCVVYNDYVAYNHVRILCITCMHYMHKNAQQTYCVYNWQNCITYCRIAVLPYCHIAVSCTMHIYIVHRVLHVLQVYGKHSNDKSTPETKTTQASENGKKVFHPNFISWSYR